MGIIPEGKHREELLDELVQKEREIAKAKEKAKVDARARKDRIGALESRRDEILDLLEGRDGVQPALPLTTKSGKPEVAPLKWEPQGENDVATTSLGTYCVEPRAVPGQSGFNVLWTPKGGKSKVLSTTAKDRPEAKAFAQRDWLEKAADAKLENAGDGKLTKGGRAKLKAMEARS